MGSTCRVEEVRVGDVFVRICGNWEVRGWFRIRCTDV
jgi:hypothetical protein